MENAADALKMAAAVLIFVLALSITINAFGEVRQTSQILLNYNDREYDYTYVEDNGTTQRIVSAETIVPSIYRAYKENFKIIFKTSTGELEIYKKNNIPICYIDLEKESLANDTEKEEFIKAILYGNKCDGWNDKILPKYSNRGITFKNEGLYDIIKENRFTEYLGIYYQEEITGTESPDVNKTEKRVITYIQN